MPTPVFIPVYTHVNSTKKIACEGYLKDYDAKTATVQQMQTYADCVKVLHPTDVAGARLLVALLLIAALVGAIIGVIKNDYDMEDRIMGAFLGALAGLGIVLVGGLFVLAVAFIFS